MEQEVSWTKRLEQRSGFDPIAVQGSYGHWSSRQSVQQIVYGLEQSNIGFQGSRHKWQGAVYPQPLATGIHVSGWGEPSVQRRGMGQFVGRPEYAYGPSEVGGWAGRPETYRREELREYSAPSLRRAEDY
jgi:hypothetical protein